MAMAAPSLECPVCFDPYATNDPAREPRLLACGHTLCHECLTGLAKNSSVQCPLDRTVCREPPSGWPKNHALLDLLALLQQPQPQQQPQSPPPQQQQPNPEAALASDIASLQAMGFSSESARLALRRHPQLDEAAMYLLEQQEDGRPFDVSTLRPEAAIDVRDTPGKWLRAHVTQCDGGKVTVSFDGWSRKWDEVIDVSTAGGAMRIAPLGKWTSNAAMEGNPFNADDPVRFRSEPDDMADGRVVRVDGNQVQVRRRDGKKVWCHVERDYIERRRADRDGGDGGGDGSDGERNQQEQKIDWIRSRIGEGHIVQGSFWDVRDWVGKWLEAEIVERDGHNAKVHFMRWDPKWDETLDLATDMWRIAPFHSFSASTGDNTPFAVGDRVQVQHVRGDRQWCDGQIRKIDGSQVQVRYQVNLKKVDYWFHVNSDEIKGD